MKDTFLPDFVFMTNFCESRGYEFKFDRNHKGIVYDLYFRGVLYKKGVKVFYSCIDAQKHCYSGLYKVLMNK